MKNGDSQDAPRARAIEALVTLRNGMLRAK